VNSAIPVPGLAMAVDRRLGLFHQRFHDLISGRVIAGLGSIHRIAKRGIIISGISDPSASRTSATFFTSWPPT
jgi:hypothetical protein